MKKENFEKILDIISELEVDQVGMIEQLFNYKLNSREEEELEETRAIRDYHNATLDPTKMNSKY